MEAIEGRYSRIAFLEGIGSLRGQHNAQNALAAVAACLRVGLDLGEIQAGLESFPGLAHRMEQVGRKGNVLFVNDSKATNADASAPALVELSAHLLDCGRPAEGGRHRAAALLFPAHRQGLSYRRGARPPFPRRSAKPCPMRYPEHLAAAVEHAAKDASEDASGEVVVLLSPACASFDQFRNFEVRGDAFRAAVHAIEDVTPIGGTS